MPAKRGGRIASGKPANGSALGFEAQLWAAAEQAAPAPHLEELEYNGARPEGLFGFSDPKSERFIKDEPRRAEAAENHSLSASNEIPRSRERERMSAGQVRVEGENPINAERVGVRCRNPRMNRRRIHSIRGKKWPCASTTTWKLARMNLAIRGIDANLGPRNADSFRADLHPDLKSDFVPVRKNLANPPFNMSGWGGEYVRQDVRWKYGMPPVNNANYAWIQHFIHHLSPVGVAGFVMANGLENAHSSPMKVLKNVWNTECQTGRGRQCLN